MAINLPVPRPPVASDSRFVKQLMEWCGKLYEAVRKIRVVGDGQTIAVNESPSGFVVSALTSPAATIPCKVTGGWSGGDSYSGDLYENGIDQPATKTNVTIHHVNMPSITAQTVQWDGWQFVTLANGKYYFSPTVHNNWQYSQSSHTLMVYFKPVELGVLTHYGFAVNIPVGTSYKYIWAAGNDLTYKSLPGSAQLVDIGTTPSNLDGEYLGQITTASDGKLIQYNDYTSLPGWPNHGITGNISVSTGPGLITLHFSNGRLISGE